MTPETSSVVNMLVDKGPMWVIAGMVILAFGYVGRLAVTTWLPDLVEAWKIGFRKHCTMVDAATEGISKSTEVISRISDQIHVNSDRMSSGQKAMADAAEHACHALLIITPVDLRPQVETHLREVVRILEQSSINRHC